MRKNLTGQKIGKLTVCCEIQRIDRGGYKYESQYWCYCECGEWVIKSNGYLIRKGMKNIKSCGCENYLDLAGKQVGYLKVLKRHGKNDRGDGFHLCLCKCGKECVIKNYLLHKNKQISCGCKIKEFGKINHRWKGYENIPGAFLSSIKCGSKNRNLEFNISLKDIWEKYIEQDKKCALTGEFLFFDTKSHTHDGNASLDRIDSSKGYIKGNIQLVLKKVNTMKFDLLQDEFIDLCKKIVKHTSN